MIVNETILSELKQNSIYIQEIQFHRTEAIPEKISGDFNVEYNYIREDLVRVGLKTILKSDNGMELLMTIIGEFELLNYRDIPRQAAKEILEKNTVAIMFPYLRSQVTIVSSQPNMPSINIPPININNMLKELKEKHG